MDGTQERRRATGVAEVRAFHPAVGQAVSTDTAVSWDGRDAGRSGMEKVDAAAQPLRELDPSLCPGSLT